NDKVSGVIKSITDFGIFVGLEGGIDGLVHLSDLSWDDSGEEAVRGYKKGDEVDAVVLSVDPERERISLGIKQIEQDPFSSWLVDTPRGSILKGTIKDVVGKDALVELAEGMEGYIRVSDISRERVEDARQALKVGEEVEAKFMDVDRKNRTISLSIKAKDMQEEQEVMQDYGRSSTSSGATTRGDRNKEQIDSGGH